MKYAGVLCFALAIGVAHAANTMKFTESYTETQVKTVKKKVVSYSVTTNDSGTFSVTWTIAGLKDTPLNTLTNFAFSLGGISFSNSLEEASVATSNKVLFAETNESTGKVFRQVLFSRAGNVLSLSATANPLSDSILASNLVGTRGTIASNLTATFQAGDYSEEALVYYTARCAVTTNRASSNVLHTVNVSGTVDTTAPTISIHYTAGTYYSGNSCTIRVKAKDDHSVGAVYVSNNSTNAGDYAEACYNSDSSCYETDVSLVEGKNIIRAYAVDASGNTSKLASKTIKATYVYYTIGGVDTIFIYVSAPTSLQ